MDAHYSLHGCQVTQLHILAESGHKPTVLQEVCVRVVQIKKVSFLYSHDLVTDDFISISKAQKPTLCATHELWLIISTITPPHLQ